MTPVSPDIKGPPPAGGQAPGPFQQAASAAPPPGDAPQMPSATDKRPPGDNRSARDIVDSNPTLKNLGNQSGVKDALKKQVGDFEHDPDAAFRASDVLKHIKSSKTSDGKERSSSVTDDGKIEGFTKDGDARHGTEAGLLQDFGKNGYSALKSDNTLDKTSDKHVKQDGTNMNNTTAAGHEILHGLSEAAGALSKALNKLPGPLKAFLGPLHMVSAAASGGLNVADTAVTGGDVKQAGKDMGHDVLNAGANIAQGVGELASDTVGKVPGLGKLVTAAIQPATTAISGGLNVADTAVQGGNVKGAAQKMGLDTAQSAVEATVGIADPTGMASSAAGNAFRGAVDKGGVPAGGGGGTADGLGSLASLGDMPGKRGKGHTSGGTSRGGTQGGADQPRGPGAADPGTSQRSTPGGAGQPHGPESADPGTSRGSTQDGASQPRSPGSVDPGTSRGGMQGGSGSAGLGGSQGVNPPASTGGRPPVNKVTNPYQGIQVETRVGDSKKFHELVKSDLDKINSKPNGQELLSRLGQAQAGHNFDPAAIKIIPAKSEPGRKWGGLAPTRNYTAGNHTNPARADNASNGQGSWSAVRYNPKQTQTPDGARPPWVGLGHELTHGLHNAEGTSASSSGGGPDGRRTSEHHTTGIGDFANEPLSENGIRQEHGLPKRTNYSGV